MLPGDLRIRSGSLGDSTNLNFREKMMKEVTIDERRIAARIKLVDEHVRTENEHSLDALMGTLNDTPLFKLNNDEVVGFDGVRAFYADLFRGFPDFHIDVTQRHVSDEAIIMEVILAAPIRMNGAEFLRLGDERSFLFAASFRLTITIGLPEREFTTTTRFYLDSSGYCLHNKPCVRKSRSRLPPTRTMFALFLIGRFLEQDSQKQLPLECGDR
jgi:hypothetical protein